MIDESALKRYQLFSSLDKEELKAVASHLKEIELADGEVVIEENDTNDQVYIVVEGEVGIYRNFNSSRGHLLREISAGNFFGEAALFHEDLSHATFKSHGKTKLYTLSHAFFDKMNMNQSRSSGLILKLAENVARKLSHVDHLLMVKAEKRRQLSWFLMLTIFLMTGFSYFLAIIRSINISEANSTLITVPMMVAIFLTYIVFMKFTGLKFSEFGVTLKNLRQTIWDGLVLSIPLLVVLSLIKFYLIQTGIVEVKPSAHFFNLPPLKLTLILYFLFSPMQEFLARGATQTPLEKLLTGAYRVPTAIIISNLVFSAFHSHLTVYFSLASFVIGLYWGWMYHRTHNLIGVSLSHAIVGIFALDVLDLDKMLKLVG